MKIQQKYSSPCKDNLGYKIKPLLLVALILLMSNQAALASLLHNGPEAKKLFKDAIWQLNNASSDQFNNDCSRIIKLTEYDLDLQRQILDESFVEVRKLLKSGDYESAQELLLFAIRLYPADEEAIKAMIALKAGLGKFDDIEPMLQQYFNLFPNNEKTWWHTNLDKAEVLTWAANVCEKRSNPGQAEHFYRLAIQETTYPVPSLIFEEWDKVADKCYYWARMYNQACLGRLLVNDGKDKMTGVSILSTIRNSLEHDPPLTRNTNPVSKSYHNDLFIWSFALDWKIDRDKTYAMLKMFPKDESII